MEKINTDYKRRNWKIQAKLVTTVTALLTSITDLLYLAISFLSLRATMGEMICCSWFTTLHAWRTRALKFRVKMALAINAFSFSASTFRFCCLHFLKIPNKKGSVTTLIQKRALKFKKVLEQSNAPRTLFRICAMPKVKEARNISPF